TDRDNRRSREHADPDSAARFAKTLIVMTRGSRPPIALVPEAGLPKTRSAILRSENSVLPPCQLLVRDANQRFQHPSPRGAHARQPNHQSGALSVAVELVRLTTPVPEREPGAA